jgi:hypothetical protein
MAGNGSPNINPGCHLSPPSTSVSHIAGKAIVMSLFSTVVNAARRFESALRSRLEFKGSWRSPFNRPTKSRVLDIPFEIAQLLAELGRRLRPRPLSDKQVAPRGGTTTVLADSAGDGRYPASRSALLQGSPRDRSACS